MALPFSSASLKWIYFVSKRFSKVDRKGRTAVTSALASLGVGFGVMALLVVISVMNGFQMEFIDAIMEISSCHVRVENVRDEDTFLSWCNQKQTGPYAVKTVLPFYEAQGLMVGSFGRDSAALVRAVSEDIYETDAGFCNQARIISGSFDLSEDDFIVLGCDLARALGARVGSEVSIFALSGSSDVSLFSKDRKFTVTGIFYSNYADINSSYSFISLKSGKKNFGSSASLIYGVKLKDSQRDAIFISNLKEDFPEASAESWRHYNRTFFGALRVEKNMLMLMVLLIFVVVAVNIYNGMRRMVYERREDIAVLTALGAKAKEVQSVFIVKGLVTGLTGALPGFILGLFLCVNIGNVFMLLSKGQYYFSYFIQMLINPQLAPYLQENPMFRIYANIPARVVFSEAAAIFFFGIFSSLVASWAAGRQILKLTVSEVLRDD